MLVIRDLRDTAPVERTSLDELPSVLASCAPISSQTAIPPLPVRKSTDELTVQRDSQGEICAIRIGAWRCVSADPQRRLAEVRRLENGCAAIRIERFADGSEHQTSEIWQLYRFDGRLLAALQISADRRFAVLTNYQAHQAQRLVTNSAGVFLPVEIWNM